MATQADQNAFLRQILRQFEYALIEELGYPLDYSQDSMQNQILSNQRYQFQLTDGFIPVSHTASTVLTGEQILRMQYYEKGMDFNLEQLQLLTKLYRQMISALLGDRPLKSRQLWIQNAQSKIANR